MQNDCFHGFVGHFNISDNFIICCMPNYFNLSFQPNRTWKVKQYWTSKLNIGLRLNYKIETSSIQFNKVTKSFKRENEFGMYQFIINIDDRKFSSHRLQNWSPVADLDMLQIRNKSQGISMFYSSRTGSLCTRWTAAPFWILSFGGGLSVPINFVFS